VETPVQDKIFAEITNQLFNSSDDNVGIPIFIFHHKMKELKLKHLTQVLVKKSPALKYNIFTNASFHHWKGFILQMDTLVADQEPRFYLDQLLDESTTLQ